MTGEPEHSLSVAAWLDRLAQSLPESAPGATPAERDAILDLARVAAHTSERIAAPISAFVVGIAFAGRSADERAALLRELVTNLEQSPGL